MLINKLIVIIFFIKFRLIDMFFWVFSGEFNKIMLTVKFFGYLIVRLLKKISNNCDGTRFNNNSNKIR